MRHSVVIKRLGYEASAGWTTYGTSLAAFSLFQSVAARYESSSENQFVVPPLGGSVGCRSIPLRQEIPPKGGTTNCAFHCFRASQLHMNAPESPCGSDCHSRQG